MVNKDIEKFYRKKSRGLQCYIADEDLSDVLKTNFDESYCFLVADGDNEKGYLRSFEIKDFEEMLGIDISEFYIELKNRCLDILARNWESIHQIKKYLGFNGSILIQHGKKFTKKPKYNIWYCDDSFISIITEIALIDDMGKTVVVDHNLKIYNKVRRSIKSLLKFKSVNIYLNGKIDESRAKNVSERFNNLIKDKLVNVDFEVV